MGTNSKCAEDRNLNVARPNYSMKAKLEAWQRAKKTADAVEATALGRREADAPDGAARQERLLLDRFRLQKAAEQVGEAWLRIERNFKTGDEGELSSRDFSKHTHSQETSSWCR
jgi:hypothetical protein